MTLKFLHFDRPMILLCVRRNLAHNLSLRKLEELMVERGLHSRSPAHPSLDCALRVHSAAMARVILSGIETVHMMRKQQAKYDCNRQASFSAQFDMLAA